MFPIKIKNKAEKVFKLCLKKKIKLSFAESCTGGLLSSLITSFPNSSKIFNSGFVTYSNLSKPQYNPPDWIFGPVWTLLYLFITIAIWNAWHKNTKNGYP